jgi:fucose permease
LNRITQAGGAGAKPFHRGFDTVLCYVFGSYWSVYLNAIGPLTPLLKADLGLSYAVSGLHYSASAVGLLVMGFCARSIMRRIGEPRSLLLAVIALVAGGIGIMLGRAPGLTIAACFLIGSLGSLTQVIVPLRLSRIHGELRAVALTELSSLSSGAAVITPLLIGLSTRSLGDWRPALALVALLSLALIPLLRRAISVEAASTGAATALPGRAGALPRLFWAFWACIVLTVSVEFGMITWSSTLLATTFSLDKSSAALSLSLFMGAMILGRILGSGLARRFRPQVLVLASIALAFGGFACFWLARLPLLSFAGLFATGLGISVQYPLLFSLALAVAGNEAARASAACNIASGTAILFLPFALGGLADLFGIRDAFLVLPLILAALAAVLAAAMRRRPA